MFIIFLLMMLGYGASKEEGQSFGDWLTNIFGSLFIDAIGIDPEKVTLEEVLNGTIPDIAKGYAKDALTERGIPEALAEKLLDPAIGKELAAILRAEGVDLTQLAKDIDINALMSDGVVYRLLTTKPDLALTLMQSLDFANPDATGENAEIVNAIAGRFKAAMQKTEVQLTLAANPQALKIMMETGSIRGVLLEHMGVEGDTRNVLDKIDFAALGIDYDALSAELKGVPVTLGVLELQALAEDKKAPVAAAVINEIFIRNLYDKLDIKTRKELLMVSLAQELKGTEYEQLAKDFLAGPSDVAGKTNADIIAALDPTVAKAVVGTVKQLLSGSFTGVEIDEATRNGVLETLKQLNLDREDIRAVLVERTSPEGRQNILRDIPDELRGQVSAAADLLHSGLEWANVSAVPIGAEGPVDGPVFTIAEQALEANAAR